MTQTTSTGVAVFSSGDETCNALTSSQGLQLVSDAQEWYIGTYCTGIIDGFITVGDVNMMPYVWQSVAEGFIRYEATLLHVLVP